MVGAILHGEKIRDDCKTDRNQGINVFINDHEIVMVPFVQNLFKSIIHAFLSNLKGYKKGKIRIEL
jgi:molybdopterin-guanine dinucleotide biosynthesis adapter protein